MNKWLIPALLFSGLSACAPISGTGAGSASAPLAGAALPDLGPAPEFTSDAWLNAAAPLRLADLRGKVVAVDMWTFG